MSVLSAKTERYLRTRGFHTGSVEKWVTFGTQGRGVRKDFCGFADIIAFGHGRILALQVCSDGGTAAHMAKLVASEAAQDWVRNGGELWLVVWRKLKGDVRRLHWAPRFFLGLWDGKLTLKEAERII